MDESLQKLLESNGYKNIRTLPSGEIAATLEMLFTCGLFVGLNQCGYARRYCYEFEKDARTALQVWDGKGDPSGPWIKEKPSNRLGPGVLQKETA